MCLGIPAKVVELKGLTAIVDFGGVKKEVSSLLEPDLKIGDYVIVHAGAIISKISEEEAVETIKVWREIYPDLWGGKVKGNG